MDEKQQIEKLAQELSEEELNEMAAGKMSPATQRKIVKYVGIGVGSAAALTLAGVGIAALYGSKTGKGPFGRLHADPNFTEDNPATAPPATASPAPDMFGKPSETISDNSDPLRRDPLSRTVESEYDSSLAEWTGGDSY